MNIWSYIQDHKKITSAVLVGIVCVVGGLYFLNPPSRIETFSVQEGTLKEEVTVSGTVQSRATIDLRFKNPGQLAVPSAPIGTVVKKGDVLTRQSTSQLDAQIEEMRAAVNIQKAKLDQMLQGNTAEDIALTSVRLEQTKLTHDVKVASAFRTLLNSSVRAEYVGEQVGLFTPSITGTYVCEKEGTYQLKTFTTVKGIAVSFSGLETGTVQVDENPRALGTCGLFVSLDADKKLEGDIRYDITLPNKKAVTYNVNFSAYSQSLAERNSALAQANAELSLKKATLRPTDVALYKSQIEQAEASLASAVVRRTDAVLKAPIDGVVTKSTGEVGEMVSSDTVVIQLVPDATLRIDINIPESKIARVRLGQPVRILLDAFGAREFTGTIMEIEPTETSIGGAIYYKGKVEIGTKDEGIRPGMTANIFIEVDKKEHVPYVPIGVITEEKGSSTVQVLSGVQIVERRVVTGIRDGNGNIEIISGIESGELVVLNKP